MVIVFRFHVEIIGLIGKCIFHFVIPQEIEYSGEYLGAKKN